jgi:subtilisin family serine protease
MKYILFLQLLILPLLVSAQISNKVILTIGDKSQKSFSDEFIESSNAEVLQYYENLNMYLVSCDDPYVLLSKAKNSGLFSIAERDEEYAVDIDYIPNDVSFGQQWHLRQGSDKDIDADEAWDLLTPSQPVTVAMFDGGLQVNHPDLIGNVDSPFNAVTNLPSNGEFVNDLDRHGTACSGVIAAVTNNSIGVSSVGDNYLKVMPVSIMSNTNGSSFTTSTSIQLNAINAAMANPNCVAIAMSYSSSTYSQTLDAAFQIASTQGRGGRGMFLCASSGNGYSSTATNYPANYSSVYGIGATTSTDLRANYSNYGNIVDISCPGSSILTTDRLGSLGYNSSDYATLSGTSFSCPLAAACGALVIFRNPQLTSVEVMSALSQTAEKVGGYVYDYNSNYPYSTRSVQIGYGRINLKSALILAGSGTPPPPPTPKHNITVQNCAIDNSAPELNQTITVSATHLTSSPNLPIVQSVLRFTLSNDMILSAEDVVLKLDTAFLGGGVASVTSSVTYTPDSPGLKYILIHADALNSIDEYVESDNSCLVQYSIAAPVFPADLQVIILSSPWTGCSNTPQPQLRYRFKNVGTTSISSWTWRIYWENSVPNSAWHSLNSINYIPNGLAPNQSSSDFVQGFNYTQFPEGVSVNRCVEILSTLPSPDQQSFNNKACLSFTRLCLLNASNAIVVDEVPTYEIYTISGQLLDEQSVDELPTGMYIIRATYSDRTEVKKISK